MRKLFSGNADFIAVVIIVVTIGISSAFNFQLRTRTELGDRVFGRVPSRIFNRVPSRLERIPARLKLAALEHREQILSKIACKK